MKRHDSLGAKTSSKKNSNFSDNTAYETSMNSGDTKPHFPNSEASPVH